MQDIWIIGMLDFCWRSTGFLSVLFNAATFRGLGLQKKGDLDFYLFHLPVVCLSFILKWQKLHNVLKHYLRYQEAQSAAVLIKGIQH